MKGGTTSGIIYPKLIVELSREYRFRQIGGTSAGAIAATMTAAAQAGQLKEKPGKPGRAFDGLSSIPEELARDLAHLFRSMMTLMIGRCASGDLWGRTATDAYRAALSKKNGTGELAALTPSQRRELREKRNVDCLVITTGLSHQRPYRFPFDTAEFTGVKAVSGNTFPSVWSLIW